MALRFLNDARYQELVTRYGEEMVSQATIYSALSEAIPAADTKGALLQEVVKEIPLERIVLETDAPYLTPVPFRGKENQPAYVKYVAEEISFIKNIPLDEVMDITTQNAERIYQI